MTDLTIVTTKPGALGLDAAAAYVSLSPSLFQELVQKGEISKPIALSARRVAWLTAELDAWLSSRPRSQCLPPPGSGYGRRGKPADASN